MNPVNRWIGLDFETYSGTDLTVHGLARYIADPDFTPLIVSYYYTEGWTVKQGTFDFIDNFELARIRLEELLDGHIVIAHNAGFEKAVLDWLGIKVELMDMIDSAVIARAAGAAGKLEAAGPQLLGIDKMEEGWPLIKLFSIPGPYQEKNGNRKFDPQIVDDNPDKWATFIEYCEVDAKIGYCIVDSYSHLNTDDEHSFQAVTMAMNETGWHIDLPLVEEMERRRQENVTMALEEFRAEHDVTNEKFFNSMPQMKAFCLEHGIKANSFDESHVARMISTITKKLNANAVPTDKRQGYQAVVDMLHTKQMLGGGSLSKLRTLLNTTASDGRLYDQYMHIGAGQTYRTSGRGVQLQNLKRLGANQIEMEDLLDDDNHFENDVLAENVRQLFTAEHEDGRLLVGDFASVESRGLAWFAGAEWKLENFRKGKDMYKVLAGQMFSISYEAVTKHQRQAGKVGELSCGYGAGDSAVQEFANGMGVEMTKEEAGVLVRDWRLVNPEILQLWTDLDAMLHQVVEGHTGDVRKQLPDGFTLVIERTKTPTSLQKLNASAKSISIKIFDSRNNMFMHRIFHGCYIRGRNVGYYKPTERKTGDLWKNSYMHPKTKQLVFYNLYGGKLAGILTQSFCREIFMRVLVKAHEWASHVPNIQLVGQFHDEIVVEWKPEISFPALGLTHVQASLKQIMSDPGQVKSFPLAAEVNEAYRYIK